MGWAIAKALSPEDGDQINQQSNLKSPYQSVWNIPVTSASGIKYDSLRKMEPNVKAAIFVNVASRCALTDINYSEL